MGEHRQIKIITKGKIRIPLKKIEINCMHFIVIFYVGNCKVKVQQLD